MNIAKVCLGTVAAVSMFFCEGMWIGCEARTTDEIQEVTEFVTGYQRAFSPEGLDTLADYVDDPESKEFQIDLFRQEAVCRYGAEGFENIETIVCPMSDGKHWVAIVDGDLMIEGFDEGMPGLKTVLVGRNEAGELKIESYGDLEYSDAFIQEMRELMLSDEIVDRSNEIAAAYNELIARRSDMMEWALETNDAVTREVGEALEAGLFDEPGSESEGAAASANGYYVVKKGDYLWRIAEEQLGDGMRWTEIYEANKALIGDNPDLLYVGIELKLTTR